MTGPCPMCHAADCEQLRAHPSEPCPIYFGVRCALLPTGANVDGRCALSLFWLAHQLGALPLTERRVMLGDLVALFGFAVSEANTDPQETAL